MKVEEEGGVPGPDQGPGWQRQSQAIEWADSWLNHVATPLKESALKERVRKLIATLSTEVGN